MCFANAEWLDGSLPGDRGFDPLGLSRPSDFVQVGQHTGLQASRGDVSFVPGVPWGRGGSVPFHGSLVSEEHARTAR